MVVRIIMNKILLLFLLISLFLSCSGNLAWKRPLDEKRSSKSAYQRCLDDNPENPAKCKDLKKTYNEKARTFHEQGQDPDWGGRRYDR